MSDTPATLREAPQFSLAEIFRWSLGFAFWFAFCGIIPTTIPGAVAGILVMAALVAARYYWVRGPQVPARLEWSYFLFVFSAAVFVSFASLIVVPEHVWLPHEAKAPEEERNFFSELGWAILLIVGHFASYAIASTLSFILALRHRPKRRMATFLLWINLPGLLLVAWYIFAVIADSLN
jgi:hypothetical protein